MPSVAGRLTRLVRAARLTGVGLAPDGVVAKPRRDDGAGATGLRRPKLEGWVPSSDAFVPRHLRPTKPPGVAARQKPILR